MKNRATRRVTAVCNFDAEMNDKIEKVIGDFLPSPVQESHRRYMVEQAKKGLQTWSSLTNATEP
jgi:hypothetical protein